MNLKSKQIIVGVYTLLCLSGFFLMDSEFFPFPYNKAPLGLPIGGMMALVYIGPFILLLGKGNKISLRGFGFIALVAFISLYLHKLLPLRFEEFHITTSISRVSLIAGFIVGICLLLLLKVLPKEQATSDDNEIKESF